ncbi:glycosyltransferase [Streptomyces sp. NPDC095817]|uniref:glycosyltransferase n=1 Tax=Streptomyces sp. NPDC095817 TaxID=3155082 RepID=UPI00331DEEEB
MSALADWIEQAAPTLLVSDVSVEVATFARLMGVPVVIAAMRGDRADPAHRLGYDLADALLAPWPAAVPEPGWPQSWHAKTVHTGAFSRYDGRPRAEQPSAEGREVVLMLGAGGAEVDKTDLSKAADATPDWNWTVLGDLGNRWEKDPWPLLCRASVVVTHAGQNAVAETAAARAPAIILPQNRPYGEQYATGRALASSGLAVVRDRWPAPEEWARLLAEAASAGGDQWRLWAPGNGADKAARLLETLASAGVRAKPDQLLGRDNTCA